MNKTGKIVLYLGSCLPLLWTIGILICAFFDIYAPVLRSFFMYSAIVYIIYGGLILWSLLLIVLRVLKKISTRMTILNFALIITGLLAAYLSMVYNIFCVSGCFFD